MPIKLPSFRARRDVYPADLWTKCPSCETMLFNKQLDKALRVCPTCGHHFRLSAAARLEQLLDHGTWAERDAGLQSVDRLGFVDQKPYPDRLVAAQTATGMRDAAVWGTGDDGRHPRRDLRHGLRVHGRLDGRRRRREGHPGGRARPRGTDPAHRRQRVGRGPDAGGHARADAAGQDARRPRTPARRPACRSSASCPTRRPAASSPRSRRSATSTSPSPNALIGFAGSRVSAGTIAQELPPGFQRSEFLFSHGFIDRVVAAPGPARRADRASCVLPARPVSTIRRRSQRGARHRRLPASGRCRSCARSPSASRSGPPADARRPRRRRIEPARRGRSARRRLGARPARPQPAPAADARVRRGDDRRLRRAPRRPSLRRRRGDGRRARPARRPARRDRRPAEGRRHRREHPAQLRDAPPGGLPQGDADHGAGRARSGCPSSPSSTSRAPTRARNPRSAASPRRSPGRSG